MIKYREAGRTRLQGNEIKIMTGRKEDRNRKNKGSGGKDDDKYREIGRNYRRR